MDNRLRQVFAEALELNSQAIKDINERSSIHTVQGWDSLGHLRLITALEKEYKIRIETMEAIELIDIVSIKKLIDHKMQ